MRAFRLVQTLNLVLLGVLAALIVAQLLGQPVPLLAVILALVASLAVRSYRDYVWGGELGRRRLAFNVLFAGVIIILLLTTGKQS